MGGMHAPAEGCKGVRTHDIAGGDRETDRDVRAEPRGLRSRAATTRPSSAASSSTRSSRPSAGTWTTRRATPRPTRTSSTRTPSGSAASTKAPDYCFRIGGTRKFFLEAKAPSVNIKDDPEPAYQLRRYAWSAKLPLSILTDFEEFAVYDCRVKPAPDGQGLQARVMYYRYTDYAEHWDEIASIFSRDAVLKGSFDKYADHARNASKAPPRWTPRSSPRSRTGGTSSPATSPCATRRCPTANSTSPCRAPSTASSSCASAKTAASSDTASFRPSSTAPDVYPRLWRSFARPTTATTPACSTSSGKRTGTKAPTS